MSPPPDDPGDSSDGRDSSSGAPLRSISGFHQDEHGDWIAELACGHDQHVRHRPPFWLLPWVTTEEGRAGKLGSPLPCPLCARGPAACEAPATD
jgi:Protein of unknown function (DUF3565)